MGNRISISFKNGDRESVALFSHWRGEKLIDEFKEYMIELRRDCAKEKFIGTPLARLEPQTVMVDFIRWLTKDEDRIAMDLYLGKNSSNGDNTDNGHRLIELSEWVPSENSSSD
jgi:hypothetical protein